MKSGSVGLKDNRDKTQEWIQEEIRKGIHPLMKQLFSRIREGGENLVMDGVWAYNEDAQFVGGKMINLCSYVAIGLMKEGEEQEEALKDLTDIIVMASRLPMKTWGILNGIIGIYRMKQKGIEKKVIAPDTWESLKTILDWRTFIDCENHMALINLPTNYYGVAFGIARYRELLGWEKEGYSQKLLDRFMEHISQYSGECGFMDETPGQGRFDRYSILVPAELTALILNTGLTVPEEIIRMLRQSASICLNMANENGYGFSYGRSTGAYGDTAVLEILAAARTGQVLNPDEEKLAYAYCTRIIRRFGEFWIDKEMDSVNLWEKGRGTDSYRNKNRILSENLSLCMQIAALENWKNPGAEEEYLKHALTEQRRQGIRGTVTPFAHGEYERCLAVVRDNQHVWMLPVISGGDKYFQKSPYLPIPYEQFMVTGVPGVFYADLVPCLTLRGGKKVMPVVYTKEVEWQQKEQEFSLTYRQDQVCDMIGEKVAGVEGIRSETCYCWKPGEISRKDVFLLSPQLEVESAEMDYLTFSAKPEEILGGIRFGEGGVYEITAQGYETCRVKAAEDSSEYHTPDGGLKNHVQWAVKFAREEQKASSDKDEEKRIELTWKICYR